MEDINRLKLLLVEKKKTSKWLSEQLKITPSTVSKWCTNTSQPDMETLRNYITNSLWNLFSIIMTYGGK